MRSRFRIAICGPAFWASTFPFPSYLPLWDTAVLCTRAVKWLPLGQPARLALPIFAPPFRGTSWKDVKAGSSGPVFYQLYLMGGRAAAEAVIERARVARFAGLVVTIDTPVSGIRERDYRNGMKELLSGSLLEKIPFLPQVLSSPLRGRGITYHSPVQTFSSRAVGNGGIGLRCALVS